ncbi:hypothetical protein IFM89_033786 [Coptis chinensis]|uniref:Protein-L-isoaspartate O-methyltransferase n=1 Tax=Coptis chinensis TaxID=261450 RepID=A0A835HNU4_9MAGN|nr:hypothetical protein IFM89_033786 [Coptis chinensis]
MGVTMNGLGEVQQGGITEVVGGMHAMLEEGGKGLIQEFPLEGVNNSEAKKPWESAGGAASVTIYVPQAMWCITTVNGDMQHDNGRLGWAEFAPYDAVHVGAAAPEIPQPLIDQLKPGGRMVIPVGKTSQELKVVDKNLDGSVSVRTETSVRYVPLTSRDAQLRGD